MSRIHGKVRVPVEKPHDLKRPERWWIRGKRWVCAKMTSRISLQESKRGWSVSDRLKGLHWNIHCIHFHRCLHTQMPVLYGDACLVPVPRKGRGSCRSFPWFLPSLLARKAHSLDANSSQLGRQLKTRAGWEDGGKVERWREDEGAERRSQRQKR